MTQTDDMIADAVADRALATGGTLTDPKMNIIRDTNGNPQIGMNTVFTSGITNGQVNYLSTINTAPGTNQPALSIDGPDTDVGITLLPKGTGSIIIYSPTNTPTIFGLGPGSSNLNLQAAGPGVVLANGIEVATISGTQTLTNKTISGASNTLTNIAISSLAPSTSAALGVGTIELGNASDTTLSRSSAGRVAVEGVDLITASSTDILTNKTLVVSGYSSTYLTDPTNMNVVMPGGSPSSYLALTPFANLYHDNLRFGTLWGAPTFEQYNGSSWVSGTLDKTLFAGLEGSIIQVFNGSSTTGARWTWNSGNIPFGYALDWLIGTVYQATACAMSLRIESSANGTSWTTRHTSTATAASQVIWLYQSDNTFDSYIRLTITTTNGQPLSLSSIKAMSSRWGAQGGGKEYEFPYSWDKNANMTIGAPTARSNGVLNIGGTSPATAASGIYFGTDTTLYRSAAGTLKTDGNLVIGGAVGSTPGSIVTVDGAQTLTNKTLTAPTIGGAAVVAQNGSLTLYNTSDQTTNYEDAVVRWRSNILEVGTLFGGTASYRNARFGVSITAGAGTVDRYLEISRLAPFASFVWGNLGLNGQAVNVGASAGSTLTASSGGQVGLGIDPGINQSGTASYTMLLINPTETTTGSGTKLLADFQVGGASFASVTNTGVMIARNFARTTVTRTAAISLGAASASVNLCDATTAAFTITLPAASTQNGLAYTIKKIDSSANAVTVASGGGTIDSAATYSLAAQYKYVRVVSNGTNWFIIGNN